MRKLFKLPGQFSPAKEDPDSRHNKKSLFRRVYTAVFPQREAKTDFQEEMVSTQSPNEEDSDLILFYLLKVTKGLMLNSSGHNSNSGELPFITTLMKELNNEIIDMKEISLCLMQGTPEKCKIIRPICWKLILGYLPPQKNKWKETIELKRQVYESYIEESFLTNKKSSFFLEKCCSFQESKDNSQIHFKSCLSTEHSQKPNNCSLSKEKPSNCEHFLEEQKLWDEIEKDTKRTRKKTAFFTKINTNNEFCEYPNHSGEMRENPIGLETHGVTITRILYVFAKMNPDMKYVQGMNEIVATLYYCFYNDQHSWFKKNCEIDTYFCFEGLLKKIRDNFTYDSLIEMEKKTKRFSEIFQRTDLQLWEHLKKNNVSPEFYFNKWLILMLTQEFDLAEILDVWDAILASGDELNYINYVCLGMLYSMREALVGEDFAGIMNLLQSTQKLNTKSILNIAHSVYKEIECKKDSFID